MRLPMSSRRQSMHPGRPPACPSMQKRAVCPTPLHLTRFSSPCTAAPPSPGDLRSRTISLKGYLSPKRPSCWFPVPAHPLPPGSNLQAPAALPTTPWQALTRTTVCPIFIRTREQGCRPLLGRASMPQTSTLPGPIYINHAPLLILYSVDMANP